MNKYTVKSKAILIAGTVALIIALLLGAGVFGVALGDGGNDHASSLRDGEKTVETVSTWSMNNSESSAFYGERTKRYSRKHERQPFNEGQDGDMDVTVNALHVDLTANDTFTYNKVIDLSKLDPLTPVFKIGVMPDDGERDARFIYFELTDVYDPSIKMSIQISTGITDANALVWANSWTIYSYIMAKTGSQVYSALVDDAIAQGTNGNIYGSIAKFGLYGQRAGYRACSDYLSIYYDHEQKQLFQQSINGRMLVCDFDDLAHFSSLFGGFTTGEVKLSMYGSTYYTDSLNVFFYEIAGEKEFSETISDITPPHISIDVPSEIPYGVVGCEYELFDATVLDPYGGNGTLVTQVFFGYGTDNAYNVTVKGGKFLPDKEGVYTVVYSVQNEFGAKTEELVEITVKAADYMPISMAAIPDDSGHVGKKIYVQTPEVTGGAGDVTLSAKVHFGEDEIGLSDNAFVPEKAGEYTVKVVASDIFGRTAERTYKVNVTLSDAPVIDESTVLLPKYFIKGATYELPKVYAYDYVNGKRKKKTAVAAKGGTLSGYKFTPTGDVAEIRYVAVRGNKSSYVSRTVPVIDVSGETEGSIDIAKYFATRNLTTEKSGENIKFAANGNGRASAEFINKFVADDFSATLMFPDSVENGSKVTVKLSDIYSGRSVEISFVREGTEIVVYYNDVRRAAYPLNEYSRISYRANKNALYYTTDRYFALDGFEGFDSGYLYFTMYIETPELGTSVCISDLYGQGINDLGYDNIRPNVASAGEYAFDVQLNGLVKVYSARYADALNPNTVATVTVTDPTGEVVTAVNGTALEDVSADREYEFIADKYGYYYIAYTAESGEYMQFETYSFIVSDTEKPTITVSGNIPQTVSVGGTLKVPEVAVKDNVDKPEDMTVKCLVHEVRTHKIQVYEIGDVITFERAGQYIVSFMTKDAAGNVATVEYSVTVK